MNPIKERYCKKGNHSVPIENFYKKSGHNYNDVQHACIDCQKKDRYRRIFEKKQGVIKAF